MPLGPAAALGHVSTIVAHYGSRAEAEAQLPGDVAAFFRAYGRIVAVLDGAVGRLTPAEAALMLATHRSGGISMPFDPSVRQLIDEGVV